MNTLQKLKVKRATNRTFFTKTITKIEPLLEKELTDENVCKVKELYELILDKSKQLQINDAEIDTLITDVNEYETELKSREEYDEKISSVRCKVTSFLENYKNLNLKNVHESKNRIDSDHEISKPSSSNVKLPKLTIEKFAGDTSLWQEFYAAFESAIHKNSTLTKLEKFVYLKSLLTQSAYSSVAGFSLTEENYESCLQLLKDRYGRRDLIINSHMGKLLNLEPVKHSSNVKGLRSCTMK